MAEHIEQPGQHLPLRRAETAAVFVLVATVLAGIVALLLSGLSRSAAAKAEAWHLLAGVLVWLVALIHQRLSRLADEEAHDAESLRAQQERQAGASLFDEQQLDLFGARNRLEQFEKYFLPAFSIIILLALGGLCALLLRRLLTIEAPAAVVQPLMTSMVFIGIAFVSFLLGKYTGGLATQTPWRRLRAGASYTMSCALGSLLVGVGLVCHHFDLPVVERVVAYMVAAALGLIAVEMALNLVLSLYRPRAEGQERHAAYDSRLLGMLTASKGLLRTTADTLDYQFGFKVSETWFYRFMERTIAPLVLFQLSTLYLLTCFVIVDSGEQAVIERFGRPLDGRHTLRPGLHLKWPWPIDIARRYPVERVEMLMVGEQLEEELDGYLWTKAHAKQAFNLLVANREAEQLPQAPPARPRGEPEAERTAEDVVAVSMLGGTIYVYYAVNDLYDFLYNYQDAKGTLDIMCYRELTRYAVSSDFLELLGSHRAAAAATLKSKFQERADLLKLGVAIVGVSLQGIHPPIEIGESFQDVVGALEEKEAFIHEAEAYRNETLPAAEATARTLTIEAESYRYRRKTVAPATAARFLKQHGVYVESPTVFRYREMLSMLEEALAGRRKIVKPDWVDADEVLIIDLKDRLLPGGFGAELDTEESTGGSEQ